MKDVRTIALVAVAAVYSLWSSGAAALETTFCPGTAITTDREYGITMPDGSGSSCLTSGGGNLNGSGDAVNLLGYITLDKNDEAKGAAQGSLFAANGSNSGSFYVDATKLVGWTDFVIAFKVGSLDPTWAAFSVPNLLACTAAAPCSWYTDPKQGGGLSHALLYGKTSGVVPIPAAVWLLLSGLGGLGLLGRRRKAA